MSCGEAGFEAADGLARVPGGHRFSGRRRRGAGPRRLWGAREHRGLAPAPKPGAERRAGWGIAGRPRTVDQPGRGRAEDRQGRLEAVFKGAGASSEIRPPAGLMHCPRRAPSYGLAAAQGGRPRAWAVRGPPPPQLHRGSEQTLVLVERCTPPAAGLDEGRGDQGGSPEARCGVRSSCCFYSSSLNDATLADRLAPRLCASRFMSALR